MPLRMLLFALCAVVSLADLPACPETGELKREAFDHDPSWEGVNNRSASPERRQIRQAFGYSRMSHAGGSPGEAGGLITPAGEPAYYAKRIRPMSLETPLEASGTFIATSGAFNILIGFFNGSTINEWRTPNSLALRFYGRGDVFCPYLEYCTSRWRAGADSPGGFAMIDEPGGGKRLRGFRIGTPHRWSLRYDPRARDGQGSITATIDDESAECAVSPGHKADGAIFNRFGLLNVVKSADGGGEVWISDVTINGSREDFSRDPGWEGRGNRRAYLSEDVRPRFDFGFSPTRYAGGKGRGEIGGRVFRGDDRSDQTMASYADSIGPLDLSHSIHASGRVSLRRAVSDSTTLIGFFSSKLSKQVRIDGGETMIPRGFMGLAVEGPSREGFFVYPIYHLGGVGAYADGDGRPRIYPDGASHAWSLDFTPESRSLRVTLGHGSAAVAVDSRAGAGDFDRFGIITTTTDGNAQQIYFDDLTYTYR